MPINKKTSSRALPPCTKTSAVPAVDYSKLLMERLGQVMAASTRVMGEFRNVSEMVEPERVTVFAKSDNEFKGFLAVADSLGRPTVKEVLRGGRTVPNLIMVDLKTPLEIEGQKVSVTEIVQSERDEASLGFCKFAAVEDSDAIRDEARGSLGGSPHLFVDEDDEEITSHIKLGSETEPRAYVFIEM